MNHRLNALSAQATADIEQAFGAISTSRYRKSEDRVWFGLVAMAHNLSKYASAYKQIKG